MNSTDFENWVEVPEELAGLPADRALEGLFPGIHRAALRRMLRDGRVLRNGVELAPRFRLRAGDLILLPEDLDPGTLPPPPRPKNEEVLERPEVLYEDGRCLALAKPAGLASVPDRRGEPSVHEHLPEWFGRDSDLRIVHRLDRGTSGVLILAKGVLAARDFDRWFREGRVRKSYLALVRGRPARDRFRCEVEIGRTMRGGKVRLGPGKGARPARTDFRLLEAFRKFSLLEARPRTGRMHQIRAHLRRIGHCLAVETLYAKDPALLLSEFKRGYRPHRGRPEVPLLARLSLHAAFTAFPGGAEGEEIRIEAPLPRDFERALRALRRHAALPGEAREAPSWTLGGLEAEEEAFVDPLDRAREGTGLPTPESSS